MVLGMGNNFLGKADTAQKLADPRTITLTGNASGSVSFDGSSNVSLSVTNASASKWTTARTLSLSGHASGSVSIDGSANVAINVNNNYASHAGYSDMVAGVYTSNGGNQPPSYIPKARVRFNMMRGLTGLGNVFSGYCDCLLMDTYSGGDVPVSTGFGIARVNAAPRAWIFNGPQGGAEWANYTELITAANIGTQTVASAANATNADTLDGFHASTTQATNTVVVRDSNGYTYLDYINSGTPINENPTISQFIVTNGSDNFYRKARVSHVKSTLGVPSVVNNITSTSTTDALSANMGRDLNTKIMSGQVATTRRVTIDGDANTYYPVIISNTAADNYAYEHYNISRIYNDVAPDTWNTSTHRGGLTLDIGWNSDGSWGGNLGLAPVVYEFKQSYSTMVANMDISVSGLVLWLRGGGAYYYFNSTIGTTFYVTPKYSTYTDPANKVFAPRTTVTENWWRGAMLYSGRTPPTASEVGALPAGGTAINSNSLGGVAAANYINTADTLILRGTV